MTDKVHKKRIGLFLVIGFICLFGIIGTFVVENIMPNNNKLFVMFFHESVKGLNVGSPVVLEGVEVGKVTRISLETNPKTLTFSIPVFVRFTQDNRTNSILKTMFQTHHSREEIINKLIKKGLRARLVTQNFLTGQLMIELVMLPDTPVKLVETPQTKGLIQIPTVLSTMGELSKGIQDLPLKEMVYKFNNILDILSEKIPVIMPQVSLLGENLNKAVPAFVNLTEQLDKTVQKVDGQIPKTDQTINHFNVTLDNISRAARSLKNLMDYLERHPEALLKGKEK